LAVTTFDTINGKIMAQHSVAVDGMYFLDPLGSVVAAKVNKNAVVNTTYTPLGQGSAPANVTFGWVGGWGYRRTNGPSGLDHVRRRHMPEQESRWLSLDQIWPFQSAFSYCVGRVMTKTDKSGLMIDSLAGLSCDKDPCQLMADCQPGSDCFAKIVTCMAKNGWGSTTDVGLIKQALSFMKDACDKTKKTPHVCIFIISSPPSDWPCPSSENACFDAWSRGSDPTGNTINFKPGPIKVPPKGEACTIPLAKGKIPCLDRVAAKGCACLISFCRPDYIDRNCYTALVHELTHCAGIKGSPTHNDPGGDPTDFVYKLGCCFCKATWVRPQGQITSPCGECDE
jgi:hypothetical protein